ncbi:MAG: DoxX family protein [Acidobacteria bacterium]|nr:DoxX family protein [Acidobacteriota bacterium]
MVTEQNGTSRKLHYGLWIIQVILALIFLFAGSMKLIVPIEEMKGPVQLPGLFLRFIGVCEVLGGIGLVLPGLLRIRPGLTPLAAAGLVIIMIGATVTTIMGGQAAIAILPFAVGVLFGGRCLGALAHRAVEREKLIFRMVCGIFLPASFL